MKKQRKEDLLYCFPVLPVSIEEQMQGRGAMNFCVFLTAGRELFVRCYHRYTGGRLIERQRYVFAKDGAVRYIFDEYKTPQWRVATKFREPRFAAGGYPYGFDNTYVILNADAYKRSDMKYSQVGSELFNCPMLYLRMYIKHPNVEYLIKAGYGHLIEENESYYNGEITVTVNHHVNLKSNNLLKMLRLNREEFKLLKGWEKRYDNYLHYREAFPQYKPCEVMEIVKAYGYERGVIDQHVSKSGLKPLRLARYINKQEIAPQLYSDYLDQCRQLHYDLSDMAISLPHDFHAMHERLSAIIQYKASEAARLAFSEHYDARKRFEYEKGDLLLRQPESMDEIVHEGKALAHCVGGYAERHAKGITNILFIRKKSEPDKPYYTVEVDNSGVIRQCYGYKNNKAGNPKPPEIKAFEEHYQQYLSEVFHGKQVKSAVRQGAGAA